MTFTPDFNAKAKQAFGRLPIWLQEEILDEVEKLLNRPELLGFGIMDVSKIYDFTLDRGGFRNYIFLTITLDSRRMVMKIRKIGSHVGPKPKP